LVDALAVDVETSEQLLPDGTRIWQHVHLFVNGQDLRDLVRTAEEPYARADERERRAGSYLGLPPAWVLPPSRHFLGQPENDDDDLDGKTFLLGCTCGVPECSPLTARVTMTDNTVRWSEFENPSRPSWTLDQLGPFNFDRSQYEEALSATRWD
jgi:hypothetical protein